MTFSIERLEEMHAEMCHKEGVHDIPARSFLSGLRVILVKLNRNNGKVNSRLSPIVSQKENIYSGPSCSS